MTALAHISSARVIEANEVTYVAVPQGRDSAGERLWGLPCNTCTGQYAVRARTLRDMIKSGRTPVCERCRKGVHVKVTEGKLRFWLRDYSLEELKEIAEAAYGDRDTWRFPSNDEASRALAEKVVMEFPYQAREFELGQYAAA